MAYVEQIKRSQFILRLMKLNNKWLFRQRPVIDALGHAPLSAYKTVKIKFNYGNN